MRDYAPPSEVYLKDLTREHVARHITGAICEQCDQPIQPGERYERKVFRVTPPNRFRSSYLKICFCHSTCPRDLRW